MLLSRAADVSFASEPGLSAYGYHTLVYYDYNDNVIKQSLDGNQVELAFQNTVYFFPYRS